MFDKYLYALGRGVRGAKQAYDAAAREPSGARGGARPRPAGSAGYMVHGYGYVVSSV